MAIELSKEPEAFQDFEHQGWQAVSGGYDQHFARLTGQSVPATLDAAGVAADSAVLDVCTGPGMLAAAALARGARVIGLDFSEQVIEVARHNVPDADFRQGDAQQLPFDDDHFDAVVCGYGVMHVPDPSKALGEMRRVVKTGGRIAISTWEAPLPENGFGLLFGALKTHGNLEVPLPHGPNFFQFSAPDRMTDALDALGLSDIALERVEQTWELSQAGDLVALVIEGTVRARALLLGQNPTARRAIESAVVAGMARYRTPAGGYRVAMPALVGSGRK